MNLQLTTKFRSSLTSSKVCSYNTDLKVLFFR